MYQQFVTAPAKNIVFKLRLISAKKEYKVSYCNLGNYTGSSYSEAIS